MKIYNAIESIPYEKNTYLTLGMFDGVHLGHQKIIKHLVRSAEGQKGRSVLVTFDSHPQSIIQKNRDQFKLLTPLDEKIYLLEGLGIDAILVLPFTAQLAAMEAESFVENYLNKQIGIRKFIIGFTHAFGKERKGNANILRRLGDRLGFTVEIVEPVQLNGEIVNSTIIRQFLLEGFISKANCFLGRNYCVYGVVKIGKGFGKELGFPTANIDLYEKTKWIPKDGVYAVWVHLNGQIYTGAANIGFSPSFEGKEWGIEVFLHDFIGDLYGQRIDIFLVDRIRDEIKFHSKKELISQIDSDKNRSIEILSLIKHSK